MIDWQPIETAPKDKAVLLYAANKAGDGSYAVGIWYFGDWGTCSPLLGDRIGFEPTHWSPLHPPQS